MKVWYITLMKLKKMKSINNIVFNLLTVIAAVFFISNNSFSENFFSEAKQEFDEKIMKILNFYFKEILFLTQKMQSLTCICKDLQK